MPTLVAILLRLFPERFRQAFARDLLATFGDRWREQPGPRLAYRTVIDLVHCAVVLHIAEARRRRHPAHRPPKGDAFMIMLWQDLRLAARTLAKTPGYTAVALVTLTLGIGANTAIFSVVNAVLFKGLAYPDPARLVFLNESLPKSPYLNVAWRDFVDWRAQNQVFTDMAAMQPNSVQFRGAAEPKSVPTAWVTSSLFSLLGARTILGRTFTAAEEQSREAGIVLGYRFWRDQMQGDPRIVGKSIAFDIGSITVAGVLAPGFKVPVGEAEVYLPLGVRANENLFVDRSSHPGLIVVARLRPGLTPARARADMKTIMDRLASAYPESNRNEKAVVAPLVDRMVGAVRSDLLILLGAVAFVLLIACANVAHLALARATGRRREFAVRAAIGASRGRLVSQLLAESALLSLGGGAAGVLLAYWLLPPLVAMYPARIPGLKEVGLDSGVLLFTLGVCLLSAGLFGLAPMLQAARAGIGGSLKEGVAAGGRPGRRLRSALFVVEVAVAIVLTAGSGLLLRSLAAVLDVNPGFQVDRLLALDVVHSGGPPQVHYRFFRSVLERVSQLPGVESASAIMCPPLQGTRWTSPYIPEGQTPPPASQRPWTVLNMAMPGYFETMRIPLLQGRYFTAADPEGSHPIAIVNQTMARLLWPNGPAVGGRVNVVYGGGLLEVVGVVSDVKQSGLETVPQPEVYVPAAQFPANFMTVVVRTSGDPALLARPAVAAIHDVDRTQAVSEIAPMSRTLAGTVARRRFSAFLLGLFAALAFILATVGVAGIMAYTVAQRSREFGIRLAIGAQPAQLSRLVLVHGLRLTGLGVLLGLAAAWALSRLITGMLFHVKSNDPLTFVVVAALLAVAALVACLLPARRAARVDPMTALRWD